LLLREFNVHADAKPTDELPPAFAPIMALVGPITAIRAVDPTGEVESGRKR
jgi:hypothetical protein